MRKQRFSVAAAVVVFLVTLPVLAAGDSGLAGTLEAFRVVINQDGTEIFEAADNARPKDLIEYRLTYKNEGDGPIRNVYITDPIPSGTQYVVESATDPTEGQVTFSIDGGNTYTEWPVLIKKKMSDGTEKVVEATPDMVTHIRWVVKDTLEPNRVITLSYRTTIK